MRDYDFEVPSWAWCVCVCVCFCCFFFLCVCVCFCWIFCLDSQSRFTRQGIGGELGDDSVRGMRIEGSGFKEQELEFRVQ